jgi:hypothetical protein
MSFNNLFYLLNPFYLSANSLKQKQSFNQSIHLLMLSRKVAHYLKQKKISEFIDYHDKICPPPKKRPNRP